MKVVLTCSTLEGQQPISFVWLKDNQIIKSVSGNSASSSVGSSADSHSSLNDKQPSTGANSLNQLHQQQLTDKFALSYGSNLNLFSLEQMQANKEKQEYVILGGGGGDLSQVNSPAVDGLNKNSNVGELLPLLSDSNIRIRQSDDYSILSIEQLELKHSGRYTCSAQNEAARTSHSSQLVINAPASITIEPKDANLVSGQSSVIECAASGQPRPTISWSKARESSNKVWDYLPVYDNLRYTTLQNGSLLISNITQREQGFYLCSAKNGFGPEVSKLIKINVHEPARFSTKYKTVEVRIEDRANMVCIATGELPITIDWLDKDGNLIQKNDKNFIIDNDPHEIEAQGGFSGPLAENSTVSRLILAKSRRLDSGHYTCQANNKYGSDKQLTNLLVQDVPDKVNQLKVTNITANAVSIRWQLSLTGNSPITSYLVQYQSDDPLDDLLFQNSKQQSLPGSSLETQTGTSTQSSANSNSDSDLDLLKVNSPQLNPAIESLKQQQANSAAFKAALEALGAGSSADEAIDRTLVELTVEQSATSLAIKDLQPFCLYRLRLAAINKIGLGEFSDWIRFKTEEAPPSGSALKINAVATGPNSIKLTWSPPDRRTWNGQLIGFNVGYRPLDSSFEFNKTVEWTAPSLEGLVLASSSEAKGNLNSKSSLVEKEKRQLTTVASKNNNTKENHQDSKFLFRQHLRQLLALQQQELVAHLTNLQRSATYLIWIQAINNRGFGPQSHAISVKTLDDVPPSAPALKIHSTSQSSITIAWSLLSNFVSSANQYSLFYRRIPMQMNLNSNSNSGQIEPTRKTNETFQENQPNNNLQLPLEPGPFLERTISSQSLINLNQNDENFGFSNNEMTDVDLRSSGSIPLHHIHQQPQHYYQQFVYKLDQLECGSVYELYMTTRNSVGKSEPSGIITTRTLGEPPQPPSNKNNLFSRIGTNEVALNLAAWSNGGCPMTHMSIRYKQAPLPLAAASNSNSNSNLNTNSNSNTNANSDSPSYKGNPESGNNKPSQQHQQATNLSSPSLTISWPITTSVPLSILASVNGQRQPSLDGSIQKLADPIYSIKNLAPGTCYELELIAYNTAGHTSAQYEFVTGSQNGSRAGFSRKESIYRLDQRGLLIDSPSDGGFLEQQGNHQSWQLFPLLTLCFLCLLLSSVFCYCRLNDSWKHQRNQRRSSQDTTATSAHQPQLNSIITPGGILSSMRQTIHSNNLNNSSPSSIGDKSLMWRINNDYNRHASLKEAPEGLEEESPGANHHYCMRNEPQQQFINSSKAFSQSLSMRDFNLISPQSTSAATLNLKNYRSGIGNQFGLNQKQHIDTQNKTFGGTLRARLLGNNSQSSFGGNNQAANVAENLQVDQNVTLDQQQQQETSWSNCGPNCKQIAHHTTYAVPNNYPADQQPLYNNQQQGNLYQVDRQDPYGQITNESTSNNIEACIQQLVSQNQQHSRCIYSTTNNNNYNLPSNTNINQSQQTNNNNNNNMTSMRTNVSTCGQQSVIESTSGSSSGIDLGNHIDSSSTTTGSNGSNVFTTGNFQQVPEMLGSGMTANGETFTFPATGMQSMSHQASGQYQS